MRSTRSRAPESGPKRQGPSGRKRTVKLVAGVTGEIAISVVKNVSQNVIQKWGRPSFFVVCQASQAETLGRRQKSIVCPTKQFHKAVPPHTIFAATELFDIFANQDPNRKVSRQNLLRSPTISAPPDPLHRSAPAQKRPMHRSPDSAT